MLDLASYGTVFFAQINSHLRDRYCFKTYLKRSCSGGPQSAQGVGQLCLLRAGSCR